MLPTNSRYSPLVMVMGDNYLELKSLGTSV